jgi:hypothetical protein
LPVLVKQGEFLIDVNFLHGVSLSSA